MKRAFTLVEVLVSVALLALISLFISSTISQTKNNNRFFKSKVDEDKKLESSIDVLYNDIYFSKSVTLQGFKKYSVLYVKGKNSLYGIVEPYVVWFVLKDNNRLIRVESARKISLPIKDENKKYVFIDEVIKNCEHFSINLSKTKKRVLVFLQIKDINSIIFEVEKL